MMTQHFIINGKLHVPISGNENMLQQLIFLPRPFPWQLVPCQPLPPAACQRTCTGPVITMQYCSVISVNYKTRTKTENHVPHVPQDKYSHQYVSVSCCVPLQAPLLCY